MVFIVKLIIPIQNTEASSSSSSEPTTSLPHTNSLEEIKEHKDEETLESVSHTDITVINTNETEENNNNEEIDDDKKHGENENTNDDDNEKLTKHGENKRHSGDSFIIEELSMETAVKRILTEMEVTNDNWVLTRDNKSYLVEFYVVCSDMVDSILDKLAYYNVGKDPNSMIIVNEATASVVPNSKTSGLVNDDSTNKNSVTSFQKFLNSLKSRLTVAQVYHAINQRGDFTVDYLAFIVCAAVLADVALVTNRPPVIVASMLLSPMMDPVLCVLFGFRLREKKLIAKGMKNTFVSIAICFFVGLLLGIVTHSIANFELVSPYPTQEISSRGTLNYLPNTVIVTVFSGVSTAFAILNNVVSAMIGNAISLSILPPAVNSGHLVFLSLLSSVDRYKNITTVTHNHSGTVTVGIECNYIWIRGYDMIYMGHSCSFPEEFAIQATISLFVTILNIACIIVIGYLVCILKDFAPNSLTNKETRKFYTEDLKEVDQATKTVGYQNLDARRLAHDAFEEYKRCMRMSSTGETDSGLAEDFSAVLAAVEEDPHYRNIRGKLSEKLDLASQVRTIAQNEMTIASSSPFWRQRAMLPHYPCNDGKADPEFEQAVGLMRRPRSVSLSSYERKRLVQVVTRKISHDQTRVQEGGAKKKIEQQKRKVKAAGKFEVTPSPNV